MLLAYVTRPQRVPCQPRHRDVFVSAQLPCSRQDGYNIYRTKQTRTAGGIQVNQERRFEEQRLQKVTTEVRAQLQETGVSTAA